MNTKVLDDCIELLESGYKVEWKKHPEYDKRMWDIFNLLVERQHIDSDYMNKAYVREKEIEDLTIDEVYSYLTWLMRGERFCDGHVSEYVDNGILLKLVKIWKKKIC